MHYIFLIRPVRFAEPISKMISKGKHNDAVGVVEKGRREGGRKQTKKKRCKTGMKVRKI